MKLNEIAVDQVWWPVLVEVPTDKGEFAKHRFEARFNLLSADEVRERLGRPLTDLDQESGPVDSDAQLIAEIWDDWRGVFEEDGATPVPLSDEVRKAVVGKLYFRRALIAAYTDMLYGRRAKN